MAVVMAVADSTVEDTSLAVAIGVEVTRLFTVMEVIAITVAMCGLATGMVTCTLITLTSVTILTMATTGLPTPATEEHQGR
jgi:hypothetical protein